MAKGVFLMNLNHIQQQSKEILAELVSKSSVNSQKILVVGCSTSEVLGKKIGTSSDLNVAKSIFLGLAEIALENQLLLAAQCCEHLNRAIVVEAQVAKKFNLEVVNVVPILKAGGAFATTCWENFKNPVAVEKIQADFGLDIGGTLIGMHIKPVAVPFKPSIKNLGYANVICARSRPKFVGGSRAQYDLNLL